MKDIKDEHLPYYRFTEREVSAFREFAKTRIDNDMMVDLFTAPEVSEFELVLDESTIVFRRLIDPMVVHVGFSASLRIGNVGIVFNGGLAIEGDSIDLVCDVRGLVGTECTENPLLRGRAENAIFDYLAIQYMKRFGGTSIIDD